MKRKISKTSIAKLSIKNRGIRDLPPELYRNISKFGRPSLNSEHQIQMFNGIKRRMEHASHQIYRQGINRYFLESPTPNDPELGETTFVRAPAQSLRYSRINSEASKAKEAVKILRPPRYHNTRALNIRDKLLMDVIHARHVVK